MVATQLHPASETIDYAAPVEGVEPLCSDLRIRLRLAIRAAGPQSDSSVFEAIARFFFAMQELTGRIEAQQLEIDELHHRFDNAKDNKEESQLVDDLKICRAANAGLRAQLEQSLDFAHKMISKQPDQRSVIEDLLVFEADDEVAAHARKLVDELMDKHFLVVKDGHVCPNIPVRKL